MKSDALDTRRHANSLTFEQKCSRVGRTNCANEIGGLLRSIDMERGREAEKLKTYQMLLERMVDVGPVALQCLYLLGTLGPEPHRRAIQTILDRGYTSDTDHIYAGAISSLLSVSDLSSRDLQVVASALHGSTADLRAAVGHALARLDPDRLQVMIDLNRRNVLECLPFARALGEALEATKARVERIQAEMVSKFGKSLKERRR